MKMFSLVGIGDRAGTGMPDAIATMTEKLGAAVDYTITHDPDRTTVCIGRQGISDSKTRDKSERQGISNLKTRDKQLENKG